MLNLTLTFRGKEHLTMLKKQKAKKQKTIITE